MKRLLIIPFLLFAAQAEAEAFSVEYEQTAWIALLDGSVVMELASGGDDFYCIGIRLSDSGINFDLGTYVEIKRRDGSYMLNEGGKRYATIDSAIKDYLKDLVKQYYDDKKRGKKVWKAFVKEGGLQQFIDFADEVIDEEFLSSPFNEIYG